MLDWIMEPWPWYVSGPLIGLMVPALLLLSGRSFGISSSFRHINAICNPKSKLPYLSGYDWRKQTWNLVFVLGVAIGGFIGNYILSTTPSPFLPPEYYTFPGVLKLVVGGILVGFGTRYANGCTSGHTIMGISNLNWPSVVASICFFIGGLVTTFLVWPVLN